LIGIFGNITAKSSYKWLVYSSIGMAAFVTVSDQTGTTLALPRIGHEFNADIPTVQWLYLVYTLFISALLLPMGKLSDTLGRRRIYISGLTVFSLGAVMAYFGQEFDLLLVAKAIQGVGAAMIQANGLALMAEAFPKRQRASAIGLYMAAIGTGAVMGPVLGGLMIDAWGWRSMYLGIAVIGGMEILLSVYVIRDVTGFTKQNAESRGIRSFDWLGAVLSAGVLSLLLISLTYSYRLGWTNPIVLTGFCVSLLLLVGFVLRELQCDDPMIDLTLFKIPVFSLGIVARFLAFMSGSPAYFLMPFYLVQVLGITESKAALFLAPASVMMAVASPLSGKLSDRWGTKWLAVIGLLYWTLGVIIFTRLEVNSSPILVSVGMILLGAGNGTFGAPNTSAVMNVAGQHRYGVVSALVNMVRTSGNLSGIAVGTTMVVASMTSMGFDPDLSVLMSLDATNTLPQEKAALMGSFVEGIKRAFTLGACLVGFAAVITIFRPDLPVES